MHPRMVQHGLRQTPPNALAAYSSVRKEKPQLGQPVRTHLERHGPDQRLAPPCRQHQVSLLRGFYKIRKGANDIMLEDRGIAEFPAIDFDMAGDDPAKIAWPRRCYVYDCMCFHAAGIVKWRSPAKRAD